MSLDNCIQNAINAGEVDQDLGRRAKQDFRDRVKRHLDQGHPAAVAERMAGDEVMDSIIQGTRSRRHATLQQLQVMQRNEARYGQAHRTDPDLILKDLERTQSMQRGLERSFMTGIHDFLREFRTTVAGTVRNRALLKQVVQELHGETSGSAAAKAIAGAVLKQYERARSLANAMGMDIPKLDDWGIQHAHHARKIAQAGFDKWFATLYDGRALDWSRIINHDTGKPFAVSKGARPLRADAVKFLRKVYDNVTTEGWKDRTPSMVMAGRSLANSRSEHRILHFASADAWMSYNDAFGTTNPFDAIVSHFRGMARDIALMNSYGPNPKMGMNHITQVIEKAARTDTRISDADRFKAVSRLDRKAKKARVMLSILSGEANVPASTFWASFLAGTRNLLTAAQLGAASLSTATDWVSARIAAKAVSLNPNTATQAMIHQLAGGFSEQQAKDMGFILDTWFETGAGAARFMGDVWAPELTSRITNGVLRASGLNFLTDRSRLAVAAAFGSDLADLAGKSFDQLPVNLRNFMAGRDIGPREWDALRDPAAIYTDPTGGKHINHHWFREHTVLPLHEAEDIALKWGALVQDHMEHGIPTASLRGRATVLGDAKPGSLGGELLRSTFMYKSYALSVLFNQMRRVMEMDGGPATKARYAAKYVAFMTIAGALAVQLKETAKGRDPRDMSGARFWGSALLQGGGVGIFGDFFSASTSRAGGGFYETAGGPVVGLASDVGRAIGSNIERYSEGKSILLGRDLVNLGRRYNPVATFQPPLPIPTRLALDRLLWDQLQLLLDPQAEDLMRQAERKQQRDFGNTSWWSRGETSPRRGPDLSRAFGAQQ